MKSSADRDPLADIDWVILALNDWARTYAPDQCLPISVEQARARIRDEGGTLAYIADALESARAVRETVRDRLLTLPGMP